MYRLGEYPIAAKFPSLQSVFYIIFYGATGEGDLLIDVFREDGTIVASVTINNVLAGPYYFSTPTVEMSGFSIWNTDIGGLGIYQIGYNYLAPAICFCSETPIVAGEFDTDGLLDGQSLEISPSDSWTYSDFTTPPTVSGGIVTPAVFTVNTNANPVTMTELCFSGTIATDEGLFFGFEDGSGALKILQVWIKPGVSNSYVYFQQAGEGGGITDAYFTADINYDELVTVGVRLKDNELEIYIGPDFTTPIYTHNNALLPASLLVDTMYVGEGSETSTSLDYFRICDTTPP